jgi:hypothetical protein
MSKLPLQSEGATSLQWVLIEEQLHHVSEFADTPSRERPTALCPICRESVRMKLGTVLVHHCAHMPGSTCIASVGETAVHLNSKLHIYTQLLKADKLNISRKCVSCSNTHETIWARNWDDVHLEYSVGSRRPDIALLKEGKVIGAIEVCVSHAIDPDKADFFKVHEIRWIEVRGSPSLYVGREQWHISKPLSIGQIGPDVKDWMCETCLEKIPKDAEERIKLRQAQLRKENKKYWKNRAQEQAQEHERKNGQKPLFGRFIDFFYPDHTWKRKTVFYTVELVQGECVSAQMEAEGEILVKLPGCNSTELNRRLNQYLASLREQGIITDSPMSWIAEKQFSGLVGYQEPRYIWSERHKKWILPQSKRDQMWVFRH